MQNYKKIVNYQAFDVIFWRFFLACLKKTVILHPDFKLKKYLR